MLPPCSLSFPTIDSWFPIYYQIKLLSILIQRVVSSADLCQYWSLWACGISTAETGGHVWDVPDDNSIREASSRRGNETGWWLFRWCAAQVITCSVKSKLEPWWTTLTNFFLANHNITSTYKDPPTLTRHAYTAYSNKHIYLKKGLKLNWQIRTTYLYEHLRKTWKHLGNQVFWWLMVT